MPPNREEADTVKTTSFPVPAWAPALTLAFHWSVPFFLQENWPPRSMTSSEAVTEKEAPLSKVPSPTRFSPWISPAEGGVVSSVRIPPRAGAETHQLSRPICLPQE